MDRKQTSRYRGRGVEADDTEEEKGTFGAKGMFYIVPVVITRMPVSVCQNSELYAKKVNSIIWYVYSIKLTAKKEFDICISTFTALFTTNERWK